MWFFRLLTCCLAARQDGVVRDTDKDIKKKVKKYSLDELKRELATLGLRVDEMDLNVRKDKKKVKRELRKRLVMELKKVELDRGNGPAFPMHIPKDVMDTLNDLDARLNMELAELEHEDRKHDVQAVVDHLLDTVDSNQGLTLAWTEPLNKEVEVGKKAKGGT
ncbi:hypothetical protein ACEWY4_020126 [Coilia grayii]|uniref:Uncharacterized protein n=1 Tax=Coilia grayii TaxID=363190 RepID=A0ABD1JBP4_9TELE